jgi:hypothetical protein
MKTKILIAFVINLLLFTGCKKGDTGPSGKDGKDGAANISSTTYNASTWLSGSGSWYVNLSVPALTSSNLNSAGVQVFFSINSGANWWALPYTEVASTDYFFNYTTSAGNVQPQWVYNGVGLGSNPNTYYSATVQLKVVVIPPALIKPGVDNTNYEEMKKAYNLKD